MSSPESVLSIHSLHKNYGKICAVDSLSLEIKKGSVFGLLGPNGSGKSTTLGMVMDVVVPSSGSFTWFGETPNHQQRKRIGAILEKPNFYPKFSATKNLQLACKIKEVGEERIAQVLEQVGLSARAGYSFHTFSLGMKQRLAIASTLLAQPEVLILDEPTNGLDPQGIAEIRQLIIDIAQSGKTIILASHLLDEVQKVCTEIAVLRQGKLIYTGKVNEGFGDEVMLEIASDDITALIQVMKVHPTYLSHRLHKGHIEVKCAKGAKSSELSKYLASHNIFPSHMAEHKKNLEQQFMEILSQNA